MDRPKMDRPREVKGTPFTRELGRLLKAGLLITAIVLAVGSLPVVFLWLWGDDLDDAASRVGFGHVVEEVSIASGDVTLAASLMLPPFAGPHPALVVAHGSGEATRFDYEQYAADLTINGYALLTYDKRGVGESTGAYADVGPTNSEAVFGELSDDVLAGVRYLQARPEIRPDKIGVLGISQGGWIAPLAAAKSDDVAFMVLISGPVVTVGEEIFYSDLTGEREQPGAGADDDELSRRLAEYDGPHGFDPAPSLEALEIPVLWVLGEGDRSIPIPETVAEIDRLIAAGKPFARELLNDVGHGMRDLRTGQRAAILPVIFQWLVQNVAAPM